MRFGITMRAAVLGAAAMGIAASAARADTYTYDVNSNGDITVTPADANTSGYISMEAAKAANHSVNGVWANGDTINLTAGKRFKSGDLTITLAASGSTWFTLNGYGAELYSTTSGQEVLTITTTGGVVVNDLWIDHTNGTSGDRTLLVTSSGAPSRGVFFDGGGIKAAPSAAGNTIGPVLIRQSTAGDYHIVGGMRNWTCEPVHASGYPDMIVFDNSTQTAATATRGYWVMDNCRVGNATNYQNGDAANDGVACLASMDLVVCGGVYHDCYGACVTQSQATSPPHQGRVYLYGVEAYHEGTKADGTFNAPSFARAALVGTEIVNCWMHDTMMGGNLASLLTTAAVYKNQLCVARGNIIQRDRARDITAITGTSELMAIHCKSQMCLVENNLIDDWDADTNNNGTWTGIVAGANQTDGWSAVIRGNVLRNVWQGIKATTTSGHLEIVGNTIDSAPATSNNAAAGTKAIALLLNGNSATRANSLILANNIVRWEPQTADTGTYAFSANGFNVRILSGYNYFYSNSNVTGDADGVNANAAALLDGVTDTAIKNSNRPDIQPDGSLTYGTYGWDHGKWPIWDHVNWHTSNLDAGTVEDATTNNTIYINVFDSADLVGAGKAVDDNYNNMIVMFVDGELAGQWRPIYDYTGATQRFTVYPPFRATTSLYDPTGDKIVVLPRISPMSGNASNSAGLMFEARTHAIQTPMDLAGRSFWPTSKIGVAVSSSAYTGAKIQAGAVAFGGHVYDFRRENPYWKTPAGRAQRMRENLARAARATFGD